ncbi:MAG: hypothetical protein J1E03_03880 [Acetatifactor sp.]|nr:hypothetical protein [Acetatifactor sp.]
MQGNGRNSGKKIAFLLAGICVGALAVWGICRLRDGSILQNNSQEEWESQSDTEASDTADAREDDTLKEEVVVGEPDDFQSQESEEMFSALVVLWDGETEDFENRTYDSSGKFLEDFGFTDMEPFYEYVDIDQKLVLELYFDEETGRGCGLYHDYSYINDNEEIMSIYGFAFQHTETNEWVPEDTYSTLTVFGDDAREEELSEYQEIYEYTDDGKLSSYEVRGIIPYLGDGNIEESVLSMNYTYRDDGTLSFKEYHHHPLVFGTWHCSMRSWYDPLERLIYSNSYITHGRFECFYIYQDDGEQPAYLLVLDNYTSSVWPEMFVYK